MTASYDASTDILTLVFRDGTVAESDEDKPGVVLDYDAAGDLVAVEIREASKRFNDPTTHTGDGRRPIEGAVAVGSQLSDRLAASHRDVGLNAEDARAWLEEAARARRESDDRGHTFADRGADGLHGPFASRAAALFVPAAIAAMLGAWARLAHSPESS